MVGQDKRAATSLLGTLGEEQVAGLTGSSLDGQLLFPGESGNVSPPDDEGQIVTAGERFYEFGIGGGRSATESVVEVNDRDFSKTLLEKGVQEGGGVDTTGDAQ